jgi:hypothetical protein
MLLPTILAAPKKGALATPHSREIEQETTPCFIARFITLYYSSTYNYLL